MCSGISVAAHKMKHIDFYFSQNTDGKNGIEVYKSGVSDGCDINKLN